MYVCVCMQNSFRSQYSYQVGDVYPLISSLPDIDTALSSRPAAMVWKRPELASASVACEQCGPASAMLRRASISASTSLYSYVYTT